MSKFAHVAVILSNLYKKGKLVRIKKGIYCKPKKSKFKKNLPIDPDEQLNYIAKKLNGYIIGVYIYNKMKLTQERPKSITVAVPYPARSFTFNQWRVECVRAYVNASSDTQTQHLIHILDAIKDINRIAGTNPQAAYNKIIRLHLPLLSDAALEQLTGLAVHYPARVRKILSDMLRQKRKKELEARLADTICPTTRFNLPNQIV
jgi:hypothetical protein